MFALFYRYLTCHGAVVENLNVYLKNHNTPSVYLVSKMADYNFEGKEEPTVLGSYNSYKGKRTTAARKLELLLDLQSKSYSSITSAQINDSLKQNERIVEILAAQAHWLLGNKHAKGKDFVDEAEA